MNVNAIFCPVARSLPRRRLWLLLAAAAVSLSPSPARADEPDAMANPFQTVKQRMRSSILPRQAGERERLAAQAESFRKSARPDGSWPDIQYDSDVRSGWLPVNHIQRLLVMAKAHATPGQPLEGNPELRDATLRALDWWLQHDYQNPNWWWNEIGVPQLIGETVLLMEPYLTESRMPKVLEIMRRAKWTPGQGQNTVWLAGNALIRGLLESDETLVKDAFHAIWAEIQLARPPAEGIQADASFHQHGDQLYSGGYGLAFGNDVARYVAHAWGTPFQTPPEKLSLFMRYLLDGQQWMVRGRIFDYSAVGREITRDGKVGVPGSWTDGPISPAGAAYGLLNAADLMAALPGPRQREFAAFAQRLRRAPDAPPLVGNRHFWKSDYMAHHRPAFFTSVKNLSERMLGAEMVNNEGRKSFHLSDGAAFLYRDGEEYYDIFAVWDWNRVPGTTAEVWDPMPPGPGVKIRGRSAFVGGVSDGLYGMAAMVLDRDALTARKAHFYFDDEYVALGAGISDTSDFPVITSVEQAWLRGPVRASGAPSPLAKGERVLDDGSSVLHNGVGYVFGPGQRVILKNEAQSGRWSDFGTGSNALREGDVFSLWIEHGQKARNASYAYTVLPDATEKTLAAYARRPTAVIVSNSPALQAVRSLAARVMQAAFYRPGVADGGRGWVLAADRPCLAQLREEADGSIIVAVSNPENAPLTVHLATDRRLAGDGATPAGAGTRLTFDLPDGDAAGSAVVKRFTRSER